MGVWDDKLDRSWQELVWRIEQEWQEEPVFTVSEINEYVRQMLNRDEFLQRVWVRGEISRWQVYQSGHAYFTSKTNKVKSLV